MSIKDDSLDVNKIEKQKFASSRIFFPCVELIAKSKKSRPMENTLNLSNVKMIPQHSKDSISLWGRNRKNVSTVLCTNRM